MRRYWADFHPLKAEEQELFAAPREVEKAVAIFNQVLEDLDHGRSEVALLKLQQLYRDFPIFKQAAHLYGMTLAVEARYAESLKVLKRVRLLDLAEDEMQILDRQIRLLEREEADEKRQARLQEKREKLLQPLKADLAVEKILIKADKKQRGAMADSEERREVARGLRPIYEDEQLERYKRVRFYLVTAFCALLALLIFFFFVRPGIIQQQAESRLALRRAEWLEQQLLAGGKSDANMNDLYNRYVEWLKQEREKEGLTK